MFDKRLFQTPPRPSMVVASWKEPIPGVLMTITITRPSALGKSDPFCGPSNP